MPNPRTAAEWAKFWYRGESASAPTTKSEIQSLADCFDAYARQQVETFRERTIKQVEAYLGVMYKAVPRDALKGYLIAAIRALKS